MAEREIAEASEKVDKLDLYFHAKKLSPNMVAIMKNLFRLLSEPIEKSIRKSKTCEPTRILKDESDFSRSDKY